MAEILGRIYAFIKKIDPGLQEDVKQLPGVIKQIQSEPPLDLEPRKRTHKKQKWHKHTMEQNYKPKQTKLQV